LEVVIADAAMFMAGAAAKTETTAVAEAGGALAVFLDAYDGEGDVPAHLQSSAFLQSCKAQLAPGGVVVANLYNGAPGTPCRRAAELFAAKLRENVGPVVSLGVDSTRGDNLVLAAGEGTGRFGRVALGAAAGKVGNRAGFAWAAEDAVEQMYWVDVEVVDGGGGGVFREVAAIYENNRGESGAGLFGRVMDALSGGGGGGSDGTASKTLYMD
jgi:hypothetical protein